MPTAVVSAVSVNGSEGRAAAQGKLKLTVIVLSGLLPGLNVGVIVTLSCEIANKHGGISSLSDGGGTFSIWSTRNCPSQIFPKCA